MHVDQLRALDATSVQSRTAKTAKPARRNGSPELIAQRAVVAYLRRVLPAGSKVASIVNEAKGTAPTAAQRARYGAKRKASGVVSGMPDLVCVLPLGAVYWIEMKAPTNGEVSTDQQGIHAEFARLSHHVGLATSIESARYLFRECWGVPLREAPGQPAFPAVVRLAKAKPGTVLINDAVPF